MLHCCCLLRLVVWPFDSTMDGKIVEGLVMVLGRSLHISYFTQGDRPDHGLWERFITAIGLELRHRTVYAVV
jgi:hypothetical protein